VIYSKNSNVYSLQNQTTITQDKITPQSESWNSLYNIYTLIYLFSLYRSLFLLLEDGCYRGYCNGESNVQAIVSCNIIAKLTVKYSKTSLNWTSICIHNRQVFDLYRLKDFLLWDLNVWFIQDSGLFRVWYCTPPRSIQEHTVDIFSQHHSYYNDLHMIHPLHWQTLYLYL
jgi:hypothetical protein